MSEAAQMSEATHKAGAPARPLLMERMLNFSDGVFAIVLTLLALDLRLPPGVDDAHLATAALRIAGSLGAFALTFGLVGVFWLVHLSTMRALVRFDWVVAAVNVVFLFTVTLTPFATALVGRFGAQGLAWRFYCVTIVLISLALCALIAASHRDEASILHAEHHGRFWYRLWRSATPGVAFAIGYGLSVAGLRQLSSLCWLLVPPLMIAVRLAFHERPGLIALQSLTSGLGRRG
jgi:uncharacterized membrane protein